MHDLEVSDMRVLRRIARVNRRDDQTISLANDRVAWKGVVHH